MHERCRGDLIILTGNRAIGSAGGPVLGFCGGRVDDADGTASLPLGPSPEQEAISPCPEEGKCQDPLGQSTIGLIYVNPGGPVDAPSDPVASVRYYQTPCSTHTAWIESPPAVVCCTN